MRKKEGCVSLVSSKRESFTGKTSIGLYSPFFEDSRSLRGTEERTGNSKGIAEPMKITFLMEPNLILNISLPLSLLLFNAKSLVSDEAAIRSTELPRCIFITKGKKPSELFRTFRGVETNLGRNIRLSFTGEYAPGCF